MKELHIHCQCDNCTGEDCGQDNPEEYEKEREKERADIRQAERKVLDDFVQWVINSRQVIGYGHILETIEKYQVEIRQSKDGEHE